jgi:hypothetical protein
VSCTTTQLWVSIIFVNFQPRCLAMARIGKTLAGQ